MRPGGRARQALKFYRSVFGRNLSIATYSDIHAVEEPGQADQVAFGRVDAPNGFRLMAYDVQPSKGYDPGENPFYVTTQSSEGDEIQPLWDALAGSATTVVIPLGAAPFAPLYRWVGRRGGKPSGSH